MPKILGSSLTEHREYTRTALFQVLFKLIGQRGFDKVTLSDVANHAGVGHAAVYNHFADRKDLLLTFMEHETGRYIEELSRALAGTQDPANRLRIYVRQQVLIARRFHFPTSGLLSEMVSRGTAGYLKTHRALVTQILSSVLTDAVDQGLIPIQELEQIIPLIHAIVTGGRSTSSDPEQRRVYLKSLDAFVLWTMGARQPAHAVPTIAQPRTTEPLEGARAPGSLRRSAVG